MRPILLAALLAPLVAHGARAAEPPRPLRPVPAPMPQTAKERLGGKWTDEQRVDDCKVPPGRRTRPRPAACPWEFGS